MFKPSPGAQGIIIIIIIIIILIITIRIIYLLLILLSGVLGLLPASGAACKRRSLSADCTRAP